VEVHDNLGTAYFSMRRFEDAAHNFEAGLKFDRTSWLSWGNLGDAYYWAPGKRQRAADAYQEAIRLADEALRVNPKDGRALAYRATYLAMLDRTQPALASIQKALSFSAQDTDVQFRAAIVYNHVDDTDRTLNSLQKALASGTSVRWVQDTPDFDHLRTNPRFQAILRGAKQ
jgi:tetratricopeptide (TPR) repeat protein